MTTTTISDHTRAAAMRYLRAIDGLGPVSRAALLQALLNLAFAEGAQSVVDMDGARGKAEELLQRVRAA